MFNNKGSIIYIEDDKLDQISFSKFLEEYQLNYECTIVSTLKDAKKLLNNKHYDIALIDYKLKDGTAFDVIEKIEGTPFIVLTGAGDENIATQAMKRGAYDYIIKDIKGSYLKSLPMIIENTIKRKKIEEELKKYQDNLENMVKVRTEELKKEIEEHEKDAEKTIKQKKQLQVNLKGMNCFFKIWNITEEPNSILQERLKKIVKLLPEAFRYPEKTYARIIYENFECTTDVFQITKWKLKSDLIINGIKKGQVEIYLNNDSAEIDEDLFLGMEISFFEAFSNRLTNLILRSEKQKSITIEERENKNITKVLSNQIKGILKKYRYITNSIYNLHLETVNNLEKFKDNVAKKEIYLEQDTLLYLDNTKDCLKVMSIYINDLEEYSKEIRHLLK